MYVTSSVVPVSDSLQAFAEVNLKPGSYVLVPSTFDAGQEAPFKLMIMCENEMPPVVELADAAVISISVSTNSLS